MNSSLEKLPKSTVKLTIKVTPQEMTKYFDQTVKRLAGQVNVSGFRKGKAPRTMLESRLGKDYVAHQAMEYAVADSYYQAIRKHDLNPVGRPHTDLKHAHDHLERDGLSFTATVPIVPPVELGNYQKVRVKPVEPRFSNKEVDEALDQLRKTRAAYAKVSRAAKQGDRVEIDFVGKVGGKEFEGGKSENHPMVLGEDNFIAGFADGIVGMKEGQVKDMKVTFPKEYHEASLAGKKATFTVTLKNVQERKLPKLDDEFAANFGAASIDDLKKRLAENLQQEKELDARRETERQVVDKVVDQATVEVPDPLVDEELDRMLNELKESVGRQGIPFEKYLEHVKKTEAEIRTESRGEAERRVKMSLVLNEVQRKEALAPSEADVKAEVEAQLAQVQDEAQKRQIQTDDFKRYVHRILGNRLAVGKLVEYATKG